MLHNAAPLCDLAQKRPFPSDNCPACAGLESFGRFDFINCCGSSAMAEKVVSRRGDGSAAWEWQHFEVQSWICVMQGLRQFTETQFCLLLCRHVGLRLPCTWNLPA